MKPRPYDPKRDTVVAGREFPKRPRDPYFPRNAQYDPRELPELRRALLDLAADGGYWHQMENERIMSEAVGVPLGNSTSSMGASVSREDGNLVIRGPRGYGPEELGAMATTAMARCENSMDWYRRSLSDAQLIHVTAELCEVLFASLDSMPDDRVLTETDPPTPAGFVVFESPFTGIDSGDKFATVRVDGLLWNRVMLPKRENWMTSTDHAVPGYAVAAFRYADINADDENMRGEREWLIEHGVDLASVQPQWLPLGRADWVIGDAIATPTHDGIDADSKAHLSMMEDRKLVAALWALVQQKRLTEQTTVTASRPASKRLERAGDRLPRDVQVIHLRRPEFRPRHDDGSTGRKVGVRFAVRPFWRNQPYGPQNSLRRLTLIEAHMRGPEGAPLQHVERVWEVDQ